MISKITKLHWGFIGATACWLACLGEGLVNWRLQSLYTGYDPYRLSLSYLGRSDSPVLAYVKIWGVCYTILFLLFALGIYQVFKPGGKLLQWIVIAWVIYALGEGIGSAFFPFDHVNGKLTFTAQVHNVVSGLSDTAFFFLPLLMSRLFPPDSWSKAKRFARYIIGVGFVLMSLFLLSKWIRPHDGLLAYAGLYQRLFLFVYYGYLLTFSLKMRSFSATQ